VEAKRWERRRPELLVWSEKEKRKKRKKKKREVISLGLILAYKNSY
jgi:hypothetical protein